MKLSLVLIVAAIILELVTSSRTPKGALVSTDFTGKVGYNLDNIPNYAIKDTKDYIINRVSDEQWRTRAYRQIKMSLYRQIYREVWFAPLLQLTLPPEPLWEIKFTSKPFLSKIQGHLHILRTYTFHSVLVGPADNLNASEPLLTIIGGSFTDNVNLPVDPEHLFQRTGYACADEASYSLDQVTSESFFQFYDQECKVEPYMPISERTYEDNLNNCHWTAFPNVTCLQALNLYAGFVETKMKWTRLKWNEKVASKYRYGEQTSPTADMIGDDQDLKDSLYVYYKFFEETSCTLNEGVHGLTASKGCVKGSGWRQLYGFTATSINAGKTALVFGDVRDNKYIENGIYQWSDCHLHYHFQHYETYRFNQTYGQKTGFCIQDTWRQFNNEYTPFNTPFGTCYYQGTSSGWGDTYIAGLDCQWIDVTGLNPGKYDLQQIVNPDDFVCEGSFILDSQGENKWIETDFVTANNTPVSRQACNFTKGYKLNNARSLLVDYTGPLQTLVTSHCKRPATVSPLKDCGFDVQMENLRCQPNKTKVIRIMNTNLRNAAVVRLCESSIQLGHSVPCEFMHALSNSVIAPNATIDIEFQCPSFRSNKETGGIYSILVSNLIPDQKIPKIKRVIV